MDFLRDSFLSALLLLYSFDPELYFIIYVSLKVSLTSTLISSLMGVPAGVIIALHEFKGRGTLITILNSLMALPTVVVGLTVYAFISRRGILGMLDLLYTQSAMVMYQVILILPIVTSLTISAVISVDDEYRKTALTLGGGTFDVSMVVLREARYGVIASVIAEFGRVIAEIGVSMMLGGNAKGYTRTMTTAMALEYDKGEFVLAVALGIVLLVISFGVNVLFNRIQRMVKR